jgi:hypothetical protein
MLVLSCWSPAVRLYRGNLCILRSSAAGTFRVKRRIGQTSSA